MSVSHVTWWVPWQVCLGIIDACIFTVYHSIQNTSKGWQWVPLFQLPSLLLLPPPALHMTLPTHIQPPSLPTDSHLLSFCKCSLLLHIKPYPYYYWASFISIAPSFSEIKYILSYLRHIYVLLYVFTFSDIKSLLIISQALSFPGPCLSPWDPVP